jgi:DNA polymerase III subunit gamma/tau
VALSNEPGDPTIREVREAKRAEAESARHAHPVVQAVLQAFPGATVIPAAPKPPPVAAEPEVSPEALVNEDGDVVIGDMASDDAAITEEDL